MKEKERTLETDDGFIDIDYMLDSVEGRMERFSEDRPLERMVSVFKGHLDLPEEEIEALVLQMFSGVDRSVSEGVVISGSINIYYITTARWKWVQLSELMGLMPGILGPLDLDPDRPERERSRFVKIPEGEGEGSGAESEEPGPPVPVRIWKGDFFSQSINRLMSRLGKNILQGNRTRPSTLVLLEIPDLSNEAPSVLYSFHERVQNDGRYFDLITAPSEKPEVDHVSLGHFMETYRKSRPLEAPSIVDGGDDRNPARESKDDDRLSGKGVMQFFEEYILYAREVCRPQISEEVLDHMMDGFMEIYNGSPDMGAESFGTLVRLSEARARSRLASRVDTEDADRSLELFKYWIGSSVSDQLTTDPISREQRPVSKCIEPGYSLDDVVLPAGRRARLELLLAQLKDEDLIFDEWGLSEIIRYGKGTIVLFHGPPGTGKTMTAEAVAKETGRELMIVDVPNVVSCWKGETPKNITRVFEAASEKEVVLLLDEADGMLTSRTAAGHPLAQSENRDVSVLLREIEAFEGVLILTTNRRENLDAALDRRINIKMGFEVPGPAERIEIWKRHLPASLPLSDDVDLERLGRTYELPGGYIKNAVLNAARLAALRKRERVDMSLLVEAAEMEREGVGSCGPAPSNSRIFDEALGSARLEVYNKKDADGYM